MVVIDGFVAMWSGLQLTHTFISLQMGLLH